MSVALQVIAAVGPVLLAVVAWAKLGPERDLTAATALSIALERLGQERERVEARVVALEARTLRLEEQLRAAGLEPVR